jgi:hypothetical protein
VRNARAPAALPDVRSTGCGHRVSHVPGAASIAVAPGRVRHQPGHRPGRPAD